MIPAEISESEIDLFNQEILKIKHDSSFKSSLVNNKKLREIIDMIGLNIENLILNCYVKNENVVPCCYDLIELSLKIGEKVNENINQVNKLIF